jgi:hypothetical protein
LSEQEHIPLDGAGPDREHIGNVQAHVGSEIRGFDGTKLSHGTVHRVGAEQIRRSEEINRLEEGPPAVGVEQEFAVARIERKAKALLGRRDLVLARRDPRKVPLPEPAAIQFLDPLLDQHTFDDLRLPVVDHLSSWTFGQRGGASMFTRDMSG